jgi:tRNA threonylcarbamoyladenosine biosynthesis protein TsaE
MHRFVTHSEAETVNAGEEFSRRLVPGSVVALTGDLGTGKTHFTKGISRGLGITENVASPTFTIISEHRGGRMPLYHFDCYRLRTPAELDEMGFEEYIDGDGVCVIEWAEMIEERLPKKRYDIVITLGENSTERTIEIRER